MYANPKYGVIKAIRAEVIPIPFKSNSRESMSRLFAGKDRDMMATLLSMMLSTGVLPYRNKPPPFKRKADQSKGLMSDSLSTEGKMTRTDLQSTGETLFR